MFHYSKITNLFCVVDEFCKEYDRIVEPNLLGNAPKRPPKMSKSEVITIAVLLHLGGFRTFKHFYIHYVQHHMKGEFPQTVSYNRFTELMQSSLMPMVLFLNFTITQASSDDREPLKQERFLDKIFGKIFADKGHIGKELTKILFVNGVQLITNIRNNMKNSLMSLSDKILLRKRSVIETVNDELKNICQIEHSRHRSFGNFLTNLISGLIAYSFLQKKPQLSLEHRKPIKFVSFNNRNQVVR